MIFTVGAAIALLAAALVTKVGSVTDTRGAALVNEAGLQRFVSKSVMHLAALTTHGAASDAQVAELVALSDRLVADTARLAASIERNEALQSLYDGGGLGVGLTRRVAAFSGMARQIAQPDAPRARLYARMADAYPALFGELNAAVSGFVADVARDQRRQLIVVGGLFTALMALALTQAVVAWRMANRQAALSISAAEAERDEIAALRDSAQHAATHDAMTKITNRRGLLDAVKTRGRAGPVTVFMLDMDGFKHINDSLGHDIGDLLLLTIATRLREASRADDIVARVGGDEFVVVPAHDPDLDSEAFAANLVHLATAPIAYVQGGRKRTARLSVNVGVATSEGPRIKPYDLLKNAELAVRRSRDRGRDGFTIYSPEFDNRSAMLRETSEELLEGLETQSFIPFYQPQVCAHTGRVLGVEALARWQRRDGRIDAPFAFLELAETLGVTAEIDHAILAAAVADYDRWRAEGVALDRVSVNVSLRRLEDKHLTDTLAAMTLPPRGALSFELLESVYLDPQNETVKWNLDYIRDRGIELEVDDFGTGHASILGVMALEPARLKIARELIAPIVDSEAKRRMISAIIDIARSMQVGLIAEGVETMAHAEILRDLGCECLQGYGFSRPIPAADIPAFIAQQHTAALATRDAG